MSFAYLLCAESMHIPFKTDRGDVFLCHKCRIPMYCAAYSSCCEWRAYLQYIKILMLHAPLYRPLHHACFICCMRCRGSPHPRTCLHVFSTYQSSQRVVACMTPSLLRGPSCCTWHSPLLHTNQAEQSSRCAMLSVVCCVAFHLYCCNHVTLPPYNAQKL